MPKKKSKPKGKAVPRTTRSRHSPFWQTSESPLESRTRKSPRLSATQFHSTPKPAEPSMSVQTPAGPSTSKSRHFRIVPEPRKRTLPKSHEFTTATTIPLVEEEDVEEVFEQVEDVEEGEEGEEGEEKEAWEVSSEHNIAVESVVPKKRSHGQLKIHDIDTPSGSKGILQVTEAQIHQISDAVTKRLASTLDTRTKKKKSKL